MCCETAWSIIWASGPATVYKVRLMAEYNLLTQRLFVRKDTPVDHYPDYVQIQGSTLPGGIH